MPRPTPSASPVRRARRAIVVAALAAALAAAATHAQEQEATSPEARISAAVAEMEHAEAVDIFVAARGLEKLGPAGIPAAKKAIEAAPPRAVLGLARFLFGQRERPAAFQALEKTVLCDDAVAGTLAARMIQDEAKGRDDVKSLKANLVKVKYPSVKIAVARALRVRAQDTDAERILKDYLRSDDGTVRAEAAFALAEVGNVDAAKPVLDEIKGEPTERGRLAREILEKEKLLGAIQGSSGLDAAGEAKLQKKKIEELEAQVKALQKGQAAAQAGGGAGIDAPLLDEIMRNIKMYYVDDGEKIEPKSLIDNAAKGMVGALDPFSSYMTEKETKDFDDSMTGKYAGIGAVVSMDPKDKILTIIRPIYSGPAYRIGLRSLDKITEVEGEPTYGKTVEELVSRLKGLPKTKVKIKVFRKGWQKEREFQLEREEIQLESVHYVMLPGKIGYLSLSQFGQNAEQEVENGLKELEAQGMRALVLDLRSNPGGLLSAAVEIADKFLKDNKLIVYSKGRNEFIAPYREFRTTDPGTHPDYPMCVVVNHASASASEIVSGALKDHGRATLVGENTFGKGSVQQLMKVKTTGEKSTLRLTIAKYYLPSGVCIHRDEKSGKGGIDPSIVVETEADPAWVIQEADRLLEQQLVEKFVTKLWGDGKELVTKLATFDRGDTSQYPGFDEFYKSLHTRLEPNHVRKLVRAHARRLVQDERGKEFAMDLQEDSQVQRSIYECLKKLGADATQFEEYATFPTKFDKVVKKTPGSDGGGPNEAESAVR